MSASTQKQLPDSSSEGDDKDYVDPILFAEGIYADQTDYERTIDELADRINKGLATPKGREPKQKADLTKPAVRPQTEWELFVATIPSDSEYAGLQEAMRALSPELSEIMRLLFFESLTQDEAAKVLGIPLGAVKSRKASAIRALSHWRINNA